MKKSDVRHVRMRAAWRRTHERMGGRRHGHGRNDRDACLVCEQGMPVSALGMDIIPSPYGSHSSFPERAGGRESDATMRGNS